MVVGGDFGSEKGDWHLETVELTRGFPQNDICVNVDNSVDFVDFLAPGM